MSTTHLLFSLVIFVSCLNFFALSDDSTYVRNILRDHLHRENSRYIGCVSKLVHQKDSLQEKKQNLQTYGYIFAEEGSPHVKEMTPNLTNTSGLMNFGLHASTRFFHVTKTNFPTRPTFDSKLIKRYHRKLSAVNKKLDRVNNKIEKCKIYRTRSEKYEKALAAMGEVEDTVQQQSKIIKNTPTMTSSNRRHTKTERKMIRALQKQLKQLKKRHKKMLKKSRTTSSRVSKLKRSMKALKLENAKYREQYEICENSARSGGIAFKPPISGRENSSSTFKKQRNYCFDFTESSCNEDNQQNITVEKCFQTLYECSRAQSKVKIQQCSNQRQVVSKSKCKRGRVSMQGGSWHHWL